MATVKTIRPNTRAKLRQLLIVITLVLASLAFIGPAKTIIAQTTDSPKATITGVVFTDRNQNGIQDAGEPGVGAVGVSDGVVIVETDRTGRYQLEIDTERRTTDLVFITKPTGYALGMDEYGTPQFFQNLGQLANGDVRTADFALIPDPMSRRNAFTFANIADPHVNPSNSNGVRTAEYWQAQIAEINSTSQNLAFIQVSGDLTDHATDAEFQAYQAGTAASRVPVWPAVGNHEYYYGGEATYQARIDNYRRHVGPEWYSFDYGDRHFLVIENNGQAPFEEQFEWVRQDLEAHASGMHVVVLMHQPMNVPFGSPSQYDQFGDLLEQYRTELVLVGHEHSNDADSSAEWVEGAMHVQTNSSSYTIDHSPRGFRFVQMRGNNVENPFREYGIEKGLTIVAPIPGGEVPAQAFNELQVNAYDTADAVRRVRYRVDGGSWHWMKPSGEFTWFTEWHGRKPAVGEHTVEVEAQNATGARWSRSATFHITNDPPLTPQPGADWTQHHGDEQHSGLAQDIINPEDLGVAWSFRTPGVFLTGSPIISDGVVYAATRDENGAGNAAVYAVDLRTGDRLWEFHTTISVHGTVAVADGIVYAQDLRSNLYALEAGSGKLLWKREPQPADPPNNQRTYGYYGVTVAGGKVFWTHQDRFGVGSQGVIAALDPKTGETIWESPMTGSTMSDGTPVVADGRVYVGNQTADRILAYDIETGEHLWTSSDQLGGWQDGIPTVVEGRIFIGSNNGIVARDAATGADLWIYRSPNVSYITANATPSTAAVADGTVYIGFPDGNVAALDAATGQLIWSCQLPGRLDFGGVHSSPVVSGDTVYVGSNNGFFYALDRHTGQVVWEWEIGAWVGAGPAISGNTIVFGAWDGNLYALTARD